MRGFQPTQAENISFKGISAALANMSTVHKMALTDGGLTMGRVGTARNKYEKMEMGFKMSMMMFLNFVAPIWLAKGLDSLSGKMFNTNVNLDPNLFNKTLSSFWIRSRIHSLQNLRRNTAG